MSAPREPVFELIYEGRNVTSELAMWPVDITYTDNHHGKADEVSVKVHNSTGEWLDAWSPEEGDKFELNYGYRDSQLVPAGEFTVDESTAEGDANGDTVDFKGLSAPKTEELRTEKHRAYEKQSLSDIVGKVAQEHGFEQEGEIEDLTFERITQNGERDLAFLRRLADDYGHYFKVAGKRLVFTSRDALRSEAPVRAYDRLSDVGQSLKRYSLRNADHVAAKKAEVTYMHPQRKKTIRGEASSANDMGLMTASGDIVKLDVRVEDEEQAKRVARSRLDKKNSPKYAGSLDLVGDEGVVAGIVIELVNFGRYSGKYLVTSSKHAMGRSGYGTSVEIEGLTDKQAADGKKASEKTKKSGNTAKTKKSSGSGGGSSSGTSLGIMGADGVIRPE